MIRVIGAKTHNLKNITVDIPRDQLVVITGPSGSGKSSLAIDTIFAEGQRQYIESFSVYSRQFFKQLPVADVDRIEGLPPMICLDQKHGTTNRRSTVGTITEIYDYLRLLLSRVGKIHCYQCQLPITQHTPKQICDWTRRLPERTKIMVLAPFPTPTVGDHAAVLKSIRRERLVRVRVDRRVYDIDQVPELKSTDRHSIEAVVDRIIVRAEVDSRLMEAIEFADKLSQGRVVIASLMPGTDEEHWSEQVFGTRYACTQCDLQYEEIQPRMFSFNNPAGACESCEGLGEVAGVSGDKLDGEAESIGNAIATCSVCQGSRLSKTARSVYFAGKHMGELLDLPIDEAISFFEKAELPADLELIAAPLVTEILHRMKFLRHVGVGDLTLGRGANSLSGGEHQRVRLATSIGSGLSNVGYVLDEPSIGLHQRDNDRLIESMRNLQRCGNSVLLVEHDEAIIRSADYVIDLGPGAGQLGGEIVAAGLPAEICEMTCSLTGDYLAGRKQIAARQQRRPIHQSRMISLKGASGRNLKSIDVQIPLDVLVCVTGVSGSGKSTLINHTLVPAILNLLDRGAPISQPYLEMTGAELVKTLIVVDQKPIGQSARGCPATVSGILDSLRNIFSATKRAKQLGFGTTRFSFNSKSGWCPQCRGLGVQTIEMSFMPDFDVLCEACGGRRYNLQTLQVKFNDLSIADVLALSVERARQFFDGFDHIARPLQSLLDVGLGYLELGQSTTTLSGGESQRLKLATELAKQDHGHTLYVLDEPTTGLHFDDIRILLAALNRLVDRGNSMIVIEHNLNLVQSADWVIDLGPDGGSAGGELLVAGTPEVVARDLRSFTGQYLSKLIFPAKI